jgi:malate dehydrogenase (oxaloacetate-decarboxylating)(NADP+)
LADIAIQTAKRARAFGHEPRVALLSFSNFGYPHREHMQRIRSGVKALDERKVDFEYDGEMNVDVALDMSLRANYPFCRLSGPANVLIMPALHSANISYKLLQAAGGGTIIGPMLLGLEKPVQIVQMNATVNDLVEAAAIAAYDAVSA